ncbi:MAG: phage holin family protein [Streptococcaceae bacterium]|nr:phage holin family protein [Streptococcaceae bacterium]MCL2680907.1 phage holin family protein [Streptococcaceae bacterium]MCL2858103.1 phage holin family protein [Streptococcaceae bacterium]
MNELLEIYRGFYFFNITDNLVYLGLIVAVTFDIILGVGRAWAQNDYNSRKFREGLVMHGLLVLCVTLVYPFLQAKALHFAVDGFLIMLSLSYLSSILINWKKMGGWIPNGIEQWIDSKLQKEVINKTKEKDYE